MFNVFDRYLRIRVHPQSLTALRHINLLHTHIYSDYNRACRCHKPNGRIYVQIAPGIFLVSYHRSSTDYLRFPSVSPSSAAILFSIFRY